MTSTLKTFVQGAAVAALLLATPAMALAETLEGMIISHDGNVLMVRNMAGDTRVTLTDATKVESVAGLVGARRETRSQSELINGLAVKIETIPGGDGLTADKVTFKPGDLKTAQAVSAGTDQAKNRVRAAQAENQRRFAMVGQFAEVGSTNVYFDTGKATISAKGRQDLMDIAKQLADTPGGIMRVAGHTDSTGSAATNQRLSAQRASAVTAFLVMQAGVPKEKIATPASLGSYAPVDNTDMGGGSAQNRRVSVHILVSKAAQSPS